MTAPVQLAPQRCISAQPNAFLDNEYPPNQIYGGTTHSSLNFTYISLNLFRKQIETAACIFRTTREMAPNKGYLADENYSYPASNISRLEKRQSQKHNNLVKTLTF